MPYQNQYPAGTASRAFTAPLVLRHGVGTGTLAGNITLTYRDSQILALDPGGASRTVTLPAARDGASFTIYNSADADERLTVYAADGTTTVVIVPAAGSATVVAEGSTWVLVAAAGQPLPRHAVQTIDMADAQVALVYGTAGAGEVKITSDVLFVDANSGTTEDLLLPAEAASFGRVLYVVNTGGEDIVVKEDSDTTTIATVSTTECAIFLCNGTAWKGGVVKTT